MTETEPALAPALKSFTDDELETLLARRQHIEQAKGMLMMTYGVNADQAFRMLREISQAQNLKLHDVADTVVKALTADGMDVAAARRHASDRLFHALYLPYSGQLALTAPRFRIQMGRQRELRIVKAFGDVDLSAAGQLREVITRVLGAGRVVVDLVQVSELDAIAASVIVRFERKASRLAKPFKIAATGPASAILMGVAEGDLRVYATYDEALDACR